MLIIILLNFREHFLGIIMIDANLPQKLLLFLENVFFVVVEFEYLKGPWHKIFYLYFSLIFSLWLWNCSFSVCIHWKCDFYIFTLVEWFQIQISLQIWIKMQKFVRPWFRAQDVIKCDKMTQKIWRYTNSCLGPFTQNKIAFLVYAYTKNVIS